MFSILNIFFFIFLCQSDKANHYFKHYYIVWNKNAFHKKGPTNENTQST